MPVPDYHGETFVAFMDISGFKEMMKKQEKAVRAIDHFYKSGYSILQQNNNVHGMFVSDCAILFVHNGNEPEGKLQSILAVVEQLNRDLLQHEIMLTTSISYGQFSYHQRLEFPGIEKNPIYGNAYVAAFLDNEAGQPRIQPGQCRIIKRGLPPIDWTKFTRIENSDKHKNYYWMVTHLNQVQSFKKSYKDAYQQKYRGMYDAINKAANDTLQGTVNRRR
jgi:hypothetical protein